MNIATLTFLTICEIIGTYEESEFEKQMEFTLKALKKRMPKSFSKDLPEFKLPYILIGDKKANCGCVVKRPLNFPVLSAIENHYGVVLGTSVRDEELILELTKDSIVQVVTKNDFLVGYPSNVLTIHANEVNVTREEIIKRAVEMEVEIYSLVKFNCIDFANYCAYGIEPPKREVILKRVQLLLNGISEINLRLQLLHSDNQSTYLIDDLSERLIKSEKAKNRITTKIKQLEN